MLITRCPHCKTSFRIRPEQLNLRGGRVRCGHCQTPFSALSALDEMPEDTALQRLGSTPASPPVAPGPSVTPTRPAAASVPPASPADTDTNFDIDLDFELEPDTLDEIDRARPGTAPAPVTAAPASEPVHEAPSPLEHHISEEIALGTRDEDDQPGGESVPQLHTIFLDDALPPTLAAEAEARATRRASQRRLLAGCLLLLVSGSLLASYVLRTQLASWQPALRPHLEQACALIGCEVPYLRDSALVKLEGSELVPLPTRSDAYRLSFTLRNEAHYPVAWPQLEIILTDRYERWLTRRILEPAEWLPSPSTNQPALSAHGELTTHLDFATDVEAVGYKVGVFYR